MNTFKEIKKSFNISIPGKEIRVAVMGNTATQFLSTAIQGYGRMKGINIVVFDADYNQIEAQLLDSKSEVYQFNPDYIILWISSVKLYEDFIDTPILIRDQFAQTVIKQISHYWDLIRNNSKSRILQPNLTEYNDNIIGSFSCKTPVSFIYQIKKLNYLLEEKLEKGNDIFPIDIHSIQMKIGQKQFFDSSLYYSAKMSVSIDAIPYVAKSILDVIKAIEGHIKKCLICDLDNTLWGGVVGDDGLGGIEIGELGRGHAFANLQRWIKGLKECGIIIAICSKNDEDIAKEPFEKHDEMILRLSDISVFVANWNDKATNIKAIQETLNIGMDSIVFIDDNPFERDLVRQKIPEIEVPELPEDPAMFLEYLQEQNYFEVASFTGVDSDRTSMYQAEYERKKLEFSFESIDDYLRSLEMVGEAKPFEQIKYARIAQLTQRSNQFNLRTIRYTEDEIEKISMDSGYETLYFSLKDRFGDHGLVSVVIMKKKSDRELFIDTWLMSCRVLKRGMEDFIINKIMEMARNNGYEIVSAEYIPTAKNKMVQDIYKLYGFSQTEKNKYRIMVRDYVQKRVYIKG